MASHIGAAGRGLRPAAFLGDAGGRPDEIRLGEFRPMVDLFDRQWFARTAALA